MSLSKTFTRIVALLLPYKGRLALALAGMVLTAATEPALAGMMKLLLDKGFASAQTFSLWLVPVFVIGVFVLRGCSTFTTSYMMAWVSGRLMADLRQRITEHYGEGQQIIRPLSTALRRRLEPVDRATHPLDSLDMLTPPGRSSVGG